MAPPAADAAPSPDPDVRGVVHSVHRKREVAGQEGLPKPDVGWIRVTRDGVEGDFNRYRHEVLADSSDQALLLLPFETLTALNAEGWPARPGDLGENITTSGVAYGQFQPGNRYRIGESVVEISKPCLPCSYLELLPFVGKARGDAFRRAVTGRRGWFARVLQSGRVEPGDPIIRIFGIRAMADLSEGNA